jgi:transposase InsO family protein
MVAWNETCTMNNNMGNFTFKDCDELMGSEIFFDINCDISYISWYFLSKWRSQNKASEVIFKDGSALTSVKIGGRLYPVFFKIIDDFSPMTLGREFFIVHSWVLYEKYIDTPYGKLYTNPDSFSLDTDLADKVFTVESETKSKGWTRENQIKKLHRYFGHCHADSLWRVIKHSSNKDEFTLAEITKICEECQTCQLSKRKMPRKKTSLPRSTAFNQVVTMDLKCFGDGTYVLWMVDDATRLIKGRVIQDKEPETIIDAIDKLWINGGGLGPGLPERAFFSDNGGEFVNQKLLNLCQAEGISLIKTASYSPQMNGLNERNHGVVDLMVEKIRRDEPKMSMQDAVNQAAWAQNTLINHQRGFSPFQLVYGRNPGIPGVSECSTGALEELSPNEISRGIFDRMSRIRLEFLKNERDWRIKTAMKDNLPSSTKIIHEIGDKVVFRDGKDGRRHEGKIVGFDGPVALIRWGNMDRRVHERELLPSFEIRQEEREETLEDEDESDTEIIPEIQPRRRGPKRKKKIEIIPEISEKLVVRESKRTKTDEETDEEITREVWTEDEDQDHMTQNPYLTKPTLFQHIDAWNKYGEKFSGLVVKYHRKNMTQFKLVEDGTRAEQWVDLRLLNYWDYSKPKPQPRIDDEHYGKPSGIILQASVEYEDEEYELFYY